MTTNSIKMMIVSNEANWRIGELVSLSWNYKEIKKSDENTYAYYAISRYICVRETAGTFLTKKLQFYNATSGQLCKATDDTVHYRLSIAYFNNKH